jgi:hypothetical protein
MFVLPSVVVSFAFAEQSQKIGIKTNNNCRILFPMNTIDLDFVIRLMITYYYCLTNCNYKIKNIY